MALHDINLFLIIGALKLHDEISLLLSDSSNHPALKLTSRDRFHLQNFLDLLAVAGGGVESRRASAETFGGGSSSLQMKVSHKFVPR